MQWLDAIAATLSEQDPENAQTYAANAAAAADSIIALQAELTAQLAPHAERRMVVFHDAYGYFTNRFELAPAIPVALGDASTPSAARIDQIRRQIAETGAACAFPEYAHDARLIETAIEGTETRLGGTLDPQGGSGAESYQDMMRQMADTITECFAAE